MPHDVLAPFLVALVTSGGFLGSIIALLKLRGDTDSQAVSQAQGAAEVMKEALEVLERERDYWKQRYETKSAMYDELLQSRRRDL